MQSFIRFPPNMLYQIMKNLKLVQKMLKQIGKQKKKQLKIQI